MASSGQDKQYSYQPEIDALLAQARGFEDKGDFAEAIGRYQAAMALVPRGDPLRDQLESVVEFLRQGPARGEPAGRTVLVSELPPETMPKAQGFGIPAWLWAILGLGSALALFLVGVALYLVLNPVPVPIPRLTGLAPTPARPAPAPTAAAPGSISPTATPSESLRFQYSFSVPNLDGDRWAVDNQTGTIVQIANGALRLKSSTTHFPFVYTRPNPFPATGNFRAVLVYRFPQVATCGAPIAMASFRLPVGLSQQDTNSQSLAAEQAGGVSIWLWHNVVYYRSGATYEDIEIGGSPADWHEAIVDYVGNVYRISINGTPVYTSPPTTARPQVLWMGLPFEMGGPGCAWDTLEVSAVQVESLP